MVFERWIMLKMFLTAVATGHLVLGVMSLIPICKSRLELAEEEYLCCLKKKGIITSCLGPFLLGVGMTLAGACPGMVLAQVGAWVPNSIFTLLGCLLGALLYGLVASTVERLTQPKTPFIHHQVHKKLNKPFALLALPACCLLAVTVLLMELFLPYQDNLEHPEKLSYNIAETIAWPPSVGGMIVGALQLPMVLVLKDTLGSSSSYVTVMSQWVVTSNLQRKFQYLAVRRTGVGNWWQVFYVSGGIVGGLSSSLASHSLASSQGVGVFEALCGGVVMLLGARLAAGCTSGHGISGVGLLMWLSLLAVPCMFGGAIVTAFIMRASNGSLDRFVNETLGISCHPVILPSCHLARDLAAGRDKLLFYSQPYLKSNFTRSELASVGPSTAATGSYIENSCTPTLATPGGKGGGNSFGCWKVGEVVETAR
ncbi:hypothetical protein C0Q70_03162 [Pomacea canaliculata]|uniref:Uncharacterized protein n=1 Tax=Pomacea canaliculata TaxID=400727 RepID=A0A2T7PS33_POMCA|nr:hypothetical protein C0Q70_03162 [Pomacea canaliculata]